MKRKAGLLVAVMAAGAIFAQAYVSLSHQAVGAPEAGSAALTATAAAIPGHVALPDLSGSTAPSDEAAFGARTLDEDVAFGFRRCHPTLRHPCHHRIRDEG